jgi:hypothetical protein
MLNFSNIAFSAVIWKAVTKIFKMEDQGVLTVAAFIQTGTIPNVRYVQGPQKLSIAPPPICNLKRALYQMQVL